jgi:hypothetical protein
MMAESIRGGEDGREPDRRRGWERVEVEVRRTGLERAEDRRCDSRRGFESGVSCPVLLFLQIITFTTFTSVIIVMNHPVVCGCDQ